MGKKNIFSDLTIDENVILRDSLSSGHTKQHRVTKNDDLFWDTSAVLDDLHDAYRDRWNTEHPNHPVK